MNKVILIGNLTRDPEISTVGSNEIALCKFGIAVNRPYSSQDGQPQTDFLNIVCWRGLGERCGKYLRKGSKVAICGAIQTRQYEAQDGSKRTAFEIVADDVQFLTPKGENGIDGGNSLPELPEVRNNNTTSRKNAGIEALKPLTDDGDLPF